MLHRGIVESHKLEGSKPILFVYPFIVAAVAFAVDVAIWPPKLIHGFACVGG